MINTFTVAKLDAETGTMGIAVASKFPAVGSLVPFADPEAGLIVTQSQARTDFGLTGIQLLKEGLTPNKCIEYLLKDDSEREVRQIAVMDTKGNVSSFTGSKCAKWAGSIEQKGYVCIGNFLAGFNVLKSMENVLKNYTDVKIWDMLLSALKAGENAGGDIRGKQAAALLVVKKNGGYGGYGDKIMDLRVDDHKDPLSELKRLLNIWKKELGID
ncbi:DUF1028 domain-containing protein [Flexistipes sinusarabici]|uniref:DUF1028 domain-containing protein n=1 Tax=Flexistipes sinusarabici TaxID=2352 RepID=UPI0026F2FB13|nr:DUF1028 domain-containing protein [Flexistipes sinusarabici]